MVTGARGGGPRMLLKLIGHITDAEPLFRLSKPDAWSMLDSAPGTLSKLDRSR